MFFKFDFIFYCVLVRVTVYVGCLSSVINDDDDDDDDNKNCTYQLCKRQLADNVIIVGPYRLSAKRPIVADTDYQLIISASRLDIQFFVTYNVHISHDVATL